MMPSVVPGLLAGGRRGARKLLGAAAAGMSPLELRRVVARICPVPSRAVATWQLAVAFHFASLAAGRAVGGQSQYRDTFFSFRGCGSSEQAAARQATGKSSPVAGIRDPGPYKVVVGRVHGRPTRTQCARSSSGGKAAIQSRSSTCTSVVAVVVVVAVTAARHGIMRSRCIGGSSGRHPHPSASELCNAADARALGVVGPPFVVTGD